jgi:hypothetical protein
MNLFAIDSLLVNNLFHDAIMFHVGSRFPTGAVIINGRRNVQQDVWNVQNPDDTVRGLLFDGIRWVSTETVDGRTSGPCLTYSGAHGAPYQGLGVGCSQSRWFVCEHGFQTTTPDPTQPTVFPPTTPSLTTTTTASGGGGPDLSQCSQREDLFNNGVYMKSYCIIPSAQTYWNALVQCQNAGMQLFVLDSSPLQREFKNSITRVLSSHPRGQLWINGVVDDECLNWYNFDPDRRLMWTGVHWVQTDDVIGRLSGECLRFSAEHSVDEPNWQGLGAACNGGSWFVCEYLT